MKTKRNFNDLPSLNDFLKEELKDPEFKKEWEKPDPWVETVQALIELRKKEALTQRELAKKLGTTQSAISRLESGSYNPSFKFLSRLAQALGKQLKIEFV